jgi:hypothetical protein
MPIVVTVNSLPTPVVTGNLGICPASSTTLDAGAGFSNYDWSNGESTQTVSINTAGPYSVTVTDGNGCQGADDVTTYNATPPSPAITGGSGFCPGETATINAGSGYSSYSWSQGSSMQSIMVNTPDTYSVTVSDSNGCIGSDSQNIVEFIPPMPPIISGGLSFCDGNTTVLDAGASLASYTWSTGETTNSIIVNTVGTFGVTVTDVNGCVGNDQVSTTMDGALPAIPGPITGPSSSLCGGTGLVYSIDPVPNTDFYVWTVPDGMTITGGQGTTSITVDAIPSFTSGIIVPKANNACGQSPTFGQQFLLAQGYPDLPGVPEGPTSGVCLVSSNTYTIDPVSGADSYNWTVPAGAVILSGQGTNTIVVKFAPFAGSADICVDAINGCGVSLCCFGNCLTVTCAIEAEDLAGPGETGNEDALGNTLRGGSKLFDELGVYPNPNNGQFRLEGDILEEGNFEIMVYSLLGDLVHYENKGYKPDGPVKEAVTLPGLANGTYIVNVKVGQKIWNKKVIIMR